MQKAICTFEAILVYKASSRAARVTPLRHCVRVSTPLHNEKKKKKYNVPRSFYVTPLNSASKDSLNPRPSKAEGKEHSSPRLGISAQEHASVLEGGGTRGLQLPEGNAERHPR